jgi:ribosomal protein S12 methylthiotransferase
MASEEKICNYLDIPIQHVNNKVLQAMGRGHDRAKLEKLLYKFREKIPDVAIRTTILTGFPGETEEAFTELLDFIGSFRFERLGVFPYSHEEDTPAYRNLKDQIPDRVKAKRAGTLMDLQQSISLQLNEQKVGRTLKVLIDRREGEYFVGRSQYDSPEVDNEVLVNYSPALHPGRFYQVRITAAGEFDLYGEIEPV